MFLQSGVMVETRGCIPQQPHASQRLVILIVRSVRVCLRPWRWLGYGGGQPRCPRSRWTRSWPSSSNGTKNVKVCLLPLPQGPAYDHAARSGLSPCRSEASSMGK
jgi:hypothetical protein